MEPLQLLNIHGQPAYSGFGPSYENVQNAKKKTLARPSRLRVIIRLVTLAVGASIVGVLAHASAVWFSSRDDILMQPNGIRMRGWPTELNLIPTWVMLAVAVIGIVVQIVALLTLVGAVRPLRESNLHTWGVFVSSIAGIAIWTAAAVYFKLQDYGGRSKWTLWSWSCSHEDLVNGKMSFQSMCVELNYCFYTSVVVAALEIVSVVQFGLQLRKVKRQGRYSRITVGKR